MQIAKAHNQSAGGRYIFKRSAWVNTNVDKRGRPRFTPAHLYARSAYTHTYTLAAFRMQRGLRRGRERFEGVVHARGGHNLVGGSMADIRGVYTADRQKPINFPFNSQPSPCQFLGDSTPAREHHPFRPRDGTAGSMNRFAIKYRGSHRPSFDRVCYGGKKRERGGRGILRETSGVESFSYSRNVIFRWNLWERALYSGMKALFEF